MIRVADLTGATLDYWTARAEGVLAADLEFRGAGSLCVRVLRNGPAGIDGVMVLDYSTNWALAGPLLEKSRFTICAAPDRKWTIPHVGFAIYGDTPLIAICRAVVRAAFGDDVGDLPCA